jgi:ATP-dependent Clp protease protease subunit
MNVYNVVPMVVEQGMHTERAYDIYSLLLKNRIVMLGSEIIQQTANLVVAQLLYLDREDSERPIQIYIQSPGGEVYAGLAIYDAMQQVAAPVSTVAVGRTASFGTVILTAGAHGLRYALPNATIHMHQPLGGAQGQVTDMMIQVNEFMRLKEHITNIMVQHTGQDNETIERDMDRDFFLTAQQSQEYGLIDEVLAGQKAWVHMNGHKTAPIPPLTK